MKQSSPRWLIALAVGLTLLTGAECTLLSAYGFLVTLYPDMFRLPHGLEGMLWFFFGESLGTIAAIPSAMYGARMLARHPDFFRYWGMTLALLTALGMATGLILSVPAGEEAVKTGVIMIGLAFVGVVLLPLALLGAVFVLVDLFAIGPTAIPVGVIMWLAVRVAFRLYQREHLEGTSV